MQLQFSPVLGVMSHTEVPDLQIWKGLGNQHRARSQDGTEPDIWLQRAPEASSGLGTLCQGPLSVAVGREAKRTLRGGYPLSVSVR